MIRSVAACVRKSYYRGIKIEIKAERHNGYFNSIYSVWDISGKVDFSKL